MNVFFRMFFFGLFINFFASFCSLAASNNYNILKNYIINSNDQDVLNWFEDYVNKSAFTKKKDIEKKNRMNKLLFDEIHSLRTEWNKKFSNNILFENAVAKAQERNYQSILQKINDSNKNDKISLNKRININSNQRENLIIIAKNKKITLKWKSQSIKEKFFKKISNMSKLLSSNKSGKNKSSSDSRESFHDYENLLIFFQNSKESKVDSYLNKISENLITKKPFLNHEYKEKAIKKSIKKLNPDQIQYIKALLVNRFSHFISNKFIDIVEEIQYQNFINIINLIDDLKKNKSEDEFQDRIKNFNFTDIQRDNLNKLLKNMELFSVEDDSIKQLPEWSNLIDRFKTALFELFELFKSYLRKIFSIEATDNLQNNEKNSKLNISIKNHMLGICKLNKKNNLQYELNDGVSHEDLIENIENIFKNLNNHFPSSFSKPEIKNKKDITAKLKRISVKNKKEITATLKGISVKISLNPNKNKIDIHLMWFSLNKILGSKTLINSISKMTELTEKEVKKKLIKINQLLPNLLMIKHSELDLILLIINDLFGKTTKMKIKFED